MSPVTRSLATLALLAAALGSPVRARGEEDPPAPSFDRVDHARPDQHLALSPQVGDEAKIRALARQLAADRPEATLGQISQWMSRNLRYDELAAYAWRTLDVMLQQRTYGGCADHAAVFGTLARAAGIPTIWVKTMDVAWIEDFRAGREGAERYRGHVFLEVHLAGAWRLLDAQAMRLWPDYDPRARVLPGNRFAYDKGDDPFDLVLSCRWEPWKAQTLAFFSALDLSLVPWARSEDLLLPWRVWIAGNDPQYRFAEEACRRLGYHVEKTFNGEWDVHLAHARGRILIVLCDGPRPVLPEAARPTLLPAGWQALAEGGPPPETGFLAHRLADGTTVILVPGQDVTSVQAGVARALASKR